ncbi:lysozyme inhibitor LprI family protein [Cellvibrio sp. OA-2007]|uniref:lysozyme inhibitor LprI family protein n=1 Tax=Cellvibrio sp. OA-2007 TaxID=529823 RepID=UPI0007847982|nr:hypothetical protein [Cellvibrio sp. OA-2007]
MKVFILVIFLFSSNESLSASFNCDLAKSKIEKLICSDSEISKKDDELAKIYYEVNDKSLDNGFLIEKQKQWLKERNRCQSEKCIMDKYVERIQVVSRWLEDEKNIDDFFLYRKYVGGDRYSESIYGEIIIDKDSIFWSNGGRNGSSGGCKVNYQLISKEVGKSYTDIEPDKLNRNDSSTYKSFKIKLEDHACNNDLKYLRLTLISGLSNYLDVIEYDKNDKIKARTHFN